MALALVSGIGTLTDAIVAAIIAFRLRKPAREDGYSYKTFRGSFFWFFAIFSIFALFMSGPLYFHDPVNAGYGYVIGHFFLYLSCAVFFYAPFNIITPDRKLIPNILATIVFLTSIPVTIINWLAYANGDNVPEYSNGVVLWRPPDIVAKYIPLTVGLTYLIFGFGLFMYHSRSTTDAFLKRRSKFISLGFLLLSFSGPLHDQTWKDNIAPYVIGLADFLVLLGFIFIAIAILPKRSQTS